MQSGAANKFSLISIVILVFTASTAFTADRMVVNEIMINEPGSETALEWVELLNAGSDSLNLKNYIFIEAADTTRFASRWLRPQAFAVLARKPIANDGSASFEQQWGNASGIWGDDSLENYILLPAKMSLRNSNDSVTLVDISNGAAETVKWSSSPPDGVSLERINPMNSATAKNFRYCKAPAMSTPGRINSVIAKQRDWGFIEDECEVFVPPGPEQPVVFQLTISNFGQVERDTVCAASSDSVALGGSMSCSP